MDQFIRYRKLVFLFLCLIPIVFRSNGLISNLLTGILALIPIVICAVLFNLEVEDGVLVELDIINTKSKFRYNKWGKFGEFVFFSAICFLVLLCTPISLSITIFISAFIAVVIHITL